MSTPQIHFPLAPFKAVSNITPFTYRDGGTFLNILESLRELLNAVVSDFNGVDATMRETIEGVNTSLAVLELEVRTALDEQTLTVDSTLANTVATLTNDINALASNLTGDVANQVTIIQNRMTEVSAQLAGISVDPDGIPTTRFPASGGDFNSYTFAHNFQVLGTDAALNSPTATSGRLWGWQINATAGIQQWLAYTDPAQTWMRYWSDSNWSQWKRVDAGNKADAVFPPGGDVNNYKGDYAFGISASKNALNIPTPGVSGRFTSIPVTETSGLQRWETYESVPRVYSRYYAEGISSWVRVDPKGYVDSAIAALPPAPASTRPSSRKSVPLALTLGPSQTASLPESGTVRLPIKYAPSVPRFRVHVSQKDPLWGTTRSETATIAGMYIGKSTTADNGAMVDVSRIGTQILVPANGAEWVSPWINREIGNGQGHLLSLSYSGAPMELIGGAYSSTDTTISGGGAGVFTKVKRAPFFIWIEAEVAANVPVVAAFGDSLSVGVGAELPVIDSWVSQWCRANNALPMHYANSGDRMANTESDSKPVWHNWDGYHVADCCMFAMGVNDVLTYATALDEMKRLHGVTIERAKRFISPIVYGVTITPSTTYTGAPEDVRRAYNVWLKTLPNGVRDIFDFADAISDDDETIIPAYTTDGTHLNAAGYALLSSSIIRPIVTVNS